MIKDLIDSAESVISWQDAVEAECAKNSGRDILPLSPSLERLRRAIERVNYGDMEVSG